MQSFIPGQRWISDTENDLGLGTILKTEHRLVTIVYMASGEIRTYSSESAPLTRVRFGPGDRITGSDDSSIIVNDVEEIDGLLAYHGVTDSGTRATLSETQLDNFMQFNRPSDKLFNGQFDRERRYHIRLSTREAEQRLARTPVNGLCGARVDLIPHQLYIANEVASRIQPRVLLADEVGLGKTIEAGLVIHSQLVRDQISRVLVIVPEPLLHQWLVEMKRRFNLKFSIVDELMYEESLMSATDGNPFLDRQLVLTTLPVLLSDPQIEAHALDAGWDTLIVDEAHHLETPDQAADTPGYDCIAELAEVIPSLLLLTATPEQMGHQGHFARLQLLDPHRFTDFEKFREEEANYRALADIATAIEKEKTLSADQQKMIDSLDLSDEQKSDPAQTVNALIDYHGTGRVMFRNTRRAVTGFPDRIFEPTVISDSDGLIDWVADKITEVAPEKLLLICKSVERVEMLNESLRSKFGIYAAVFHEEMSIVERDRAAEYFADDESGSPILICSEIGSEGRNFQFLHQMILVDLPDNADLLEQRIGRLDRIGQSQEIKILVPYVKSTEGVKASKDAFLQRWYHEGLNAFEQTCQVGESVKAELIDRFNNAIVGEEDINALVDDASVLAQKHREKIEQGRDRLLELSSHKESISEELITEIDLFDTENVLQRYMDQALDNLGVDIEDQSTHSFIIKPGEHMAVTEFPGLNEDGATITFRRPIALAREDVQFLTWEHPFVQTAMEQIISGGFGQVSVGAMQHESLKRGSVLLEAHYVFDCPAPKALNVEQFLSGDLLRVVLSSDGKNLTETWDHDMLNDAFHSIKKPLAKQLVDAKRQELQTMLGNAETLADDQLELLKSNAIEQAEARLGAELDRLTRLAKRNDSVREDELQGLKDTLEATKRALTQLRCVLDAVRVFGVA